MRFAAGRVVEVFHVKRGAVVWRWMPRTDIQRRPIHGHHPGKIAVPSCPFASSMRHEGTAIRSEFSDGYQAVHPTRGSGPREVQDAAIYRAQRQRIHRPLVPVRGRDAARRDGNLTPGPLYRFT